VNSLVERHGKLRPQSRKSLMFQAGYFLGDVALAVTFNPAKLQPPIVLNRRSNQRPTLAARQIEQNVFVRVVIILLELAIVIQPPA
jgi:hypothetical protein